MHVVRHEALFATRHVEPVRMRERITDVFLTALPVLLHRVEAELVVLVVPLVGLVLIDEVHHIDRTAVGGLFGEAEQRIRFERVGRNVCKQLLDEARVLLTILEHVGNRARTA